MATWSPVDFQVPEAQRLADLTGVAHDLEVAANMCGVYLDYRDRGDIGDLWQKQALSISAVTMYMRTATSGVRQGVTENHIAQLDPHHQAFHKYIKALRDKWVAHSVNALEETRVVVYPVPEGRGERGITQVTTQHRFTCSLSFDDANQLIVLAQELKRLVDSEIEDEKARLLEYARSLPVDPFYDQPDRYSLKGQSKLPELPRRKYSS